MKPYDILIRMAAELREILFFDSELYFMEGICHTHSDPTRALELIQKGIDLLTTNRIQNPLPRIKYELESILIKTGPYAKRMGRQELDVIIAKFRECMAKERTITDPGAMILKVQPEYHEVVRNQIYLC